MGQLLLTDFIGLSQVEKARYYDSELKSKEANYKWESALKLAIQTNNMRHVAQLGGLKPFIHAYQQSKLQNDANGIPEHNGDAEGQKIQADEFLIAYGIGEKYANLLESHLWGCSEICSYPEGISHYGCHQMIGDVWEWTSSEFIGYPGFQSGFDEYNDKWFTNQKVLRGGSFATPTMSIRGSYRNFFRLDDRWLFSGFRCVEDI